MEKKGKKLENKNLYFRDSYDKERVIHAGVTSETAYEYIKEFCNIRNYTIPYYRVWTEPDGAVWYDVGSHSEFFILK